MLHECTNACMDEGMLHFQTHTGGNKRTSQVAQASASRTASEKVVGSWNAGLDTTPLTTSARSCNLPTVHKFSKFSTEWL